MDVLLAIDGGGTKTQVIMANTKGEVLATKTYGGTNLNTFGIEKAFATIEESLMDFSEIAMNNDLKFAGIYFGLAGGVNGNNQEITYNYFKNKYFKDIPFSNAGDDLNSINVGVKNAPDGIAVIAGTGSNVMLKSDGQVLPNPQLSGWGYMFDNGASGYDFGRDAVIAAKNDYNGTGEHTLITKMLEAKFRSSVFDALGTIYSNGPKFIASLAPIVFEAYQQGDEVAKRIIENQTANVANMVSKGHQIIGDHKEADVGLVGGIFKHEMKVLEPMLSKKLSAKLKLHSPKEAQIYGALMEAAKNAGIVADDKFLTNYNLTISFPLLQSGPNGFQK